MSMNEFERRENPVEEEHSSCTGQNYTCPDDFSEDDLAFAQELNALFSPETEELPPYYVQTLLDADDQRFEPVERGFEHKTSARVFRRLKLRRRLFYTHPSPFSMFNAGMGNAPTRRPLLVVVAAFLLVLFCTVAFTGPSFASGVALLLHGTAGSGAYQVKTYHVGQAQPPLYDMQSNAPAQLSLLAAQQQLHFPIYWPQSKPDAYTLQHINLYTNLDQQWADGPLLEFEYSLSPSAVVPKGTGEIWIREFKPKADVLQMVKEGSSVPIQLDDNGRATAIYVDGQWSRRGRNAPVWVFGERSELIYQIDGVVFWIVGDQRDGIGEPQLMQIAQGLTPHALTRQFLMMGNPIYVERLNQDIRSPFDTDVIVYADGIDGPYFMNVSSYQPPAPPPANMS